MINTNFSCYFSSSLSRSDDNRRAAGDFANLIVWCHPSNVLSSIVSARLMSHVSRLMSPTFLQRQRNGFELPHDAVPASRSDDNRRAAGAVVFSAFRIHCIQTNSSADCRPGGEAFSVIRVFCGFYNKKFSCPFVSFVVCQLMFFIMNSASRS